MASNNNIPKILAKQVLYDNMDLDAYLKDNILPKEETMKKTEIEELVKRTINPVPAATYYNDPTTIPIINGVQIIFYASGSGTMKITMGNKVYERVLENVSDCDWLLWIQNGETQGSLINSAGYRTHMIVGKIVESADIEWIPDKSTNQAYVFITIM